jgi:cytochrome b561
LRPWEKAAAWLGHVALYVLMFAPALSGWALAGTFRAPMNEALFGLVRVPAITSSGDRPLHDFLEQAHWYLSYALAFVVLAHVVGALRHHFVKRNDVMRRMLSE